MVGFSIDLYKKKLINPNSVITPNMPGDEDLLKVHTKEYLDSLHSSIKVAQITEFPPIALFPRFLVRNRVLIPMLYAVGGTILAGKVASERGWAINLGGGMHHAHASDGGGWCVYADITLSIYFPRKANPLVKRIMIIDLDVHQGNGHERDFINDPNTFIFDMYNRQIYPNDTYAKGAIGCRVELPSYTEDKEYLELLQLNLVRCFKQFDPDIIYYNAGTDLLEGDPLGHLSISEQGVIKRDELVFQQALSRTIPIVMVLSGGYQRDTWEVISNSIENLFMKFELLTKDHLPRKKARISQEIQEKLDIDDSGTLSLDLTPTADDIDSKKSAKSDPDLIDE